MPAVFGVSASRRVSGEGNFPEGITIDRYLDDFLGNLIDTLEVGTDEAAVKFALQSLAENSGFDRYAYVGLRAGGHHAFTNYPLEWQQRYRSENYFTLDPIVIQACRTMRPVSWTYGERGRHNEVVRRFFDEANEFGISSGVVVPIKAGFGSTVMLALASECEKAGSIAIRDVAYAASAVAFVHFSLLRISSRNTAALDISLSPRELTCVAWASMGKTKAETAKMLGITEKTVRFYLERSREKLGATNIAHAVRIAMERNLL